MWKARLSVGRTEERSAGSRPSFSSSTLGSGAGGTVTRCRTDPVAISVPSVGSGATTHPELDTACGHGGTTVARDGCARSRSSNAVQIVGYAFTATPMNAHHSEANDKLTDLRD